jgi:hypothetical protein
MDSYMPEYQGTPKATNNVTLDRVINPYTIIGFLILAIIGLYLMTEREHEAWQDGTLRALGETITENRKFSEETRAIQRDRATVINNVIPKLEAQIQIINNEIRSIEGKLRDIDYTSKDTLARLARLEQRSDTMSQRILSLAQKLDKLPGLKSDLDIIEEFVPDMGIPN